VVAATRISVTLAILVIAATPVLTGIVVGAVMHPNKPWRDTFEVAAAGSGVLVGVMAVLIIGALIAHPTTCSYAHCHDNDNEAGVQVVFAALLAPLLYPFVLVGAAIGKLLRRGIKRVRRA
jgi:NADH:ubiquinone oxidoreductase subunit 6 (subunit J)